VFNKEQTTLRVSGTKELRVQVLEEVADCYGAGWWYEVGALSLVALMFSYAVSQPDSCGRLFLRPLKPG
jgi:hypothetical protein